MSFDFSLDPLLSFEREFQRASQAIAKEPNAMSLATVSQTGIPSVRTVLFKGLMHGGLIFFTNYDSQKSQELTANKHACALFFWNVLEVQVRFSTQAVRLSREENETYFRSRPRLSQIGAWASQQSRTIPDRDYLDKRMSHFESQFAGQEVPCPEHWGGWLLLPLSIEFWFGQHGRLHDRYVFTRASVQEVSWQRTLKSP